MSESNIQAPFDVIFFDCDSTLVQVEGVDELAKLKGVEAEIAQLTNDAMAGDVPLEAVYGKRLERIAPTRTEVEWLGQRYIDTVTPGAGELVRALLDAKIEVHVVSGGLLGPVRALAEHFGVSTLNVHAVDLFFDDAGCYRDFDRACPLARAGGKAEVCEVALAGRPVRSVLVGDGVTDLEARTVVSTVIGFGGVVARDAVIESADAFVHELHPGGLARLLIG